MNKFKLKAFVIVIAGILAFSGLIYAASTVTQSRQAVNHDVMTLIFNWVADATTAEVSAAESTSDIDGWVFMVETIPSATAPTADYDVVLKNAAGIDIVGGALADRADATPEAALPLLATGTYGERFVDGKLTMEITNNLVSAAEGQVKIYFYQYRHTR